MKKWLVIAASLAACVLFSGCTSNVANVEGHLGRCGLGAGFNIGPGKEGCREPVRYGGGYGAPAGGAVPSYYRAGPIAPHWVRTEHPPNKPGQYRCDATTGRPASPGNAWCVP